jgi:hypothetical protein
MIDLQYPAHPRRCSFGRGACARCGLLLLVLCSTAGQSGAQDSDDNPALAADSETRLRFLADRFAEFSVQRPGGGAAALAATPEPVLRYSNPVRAIGLSDGVVFLWLDGVRPAAAASLSLRAQGTMHREFTHLGAHPLECTRSGAALWSPQGPGPEWKPLDGNPPATGKSARLSQLRAQARRFSGLYYKANTDEPFELRVLPQPLYRYEEEATRTLDGTIFALAEANDPEVLLMIEAVAGEAGDEGTWRYALARMSSTRMIVRLDDGEVWSTTRYWTSPRTPRDPYMEAADGKFTAEAVVPPP